MITITDLNGSRNYLLSRVLKKIAAYLLLFIVVVFISGAVYIKYLGAKIDKFVETKNELQSQNKILAQKIEESKLEFKAIEGKISELESEFGLYAEDGEGIIDRIAQVKKSSAQEIKERAAAIVNKTFTRAEKKAIFRQIPNGSVLKDFKLIEKFGWRTHPLLKTKRFHLGVDLRAPLQTPIYAPADGLVQFNGVGATGYGNLLEIRHNYGFTTHYAHLDAQKVVNVGDFVNKGDLIAYSGNSGRTTGPHLHYEIRFLQVPVDPMHYIEWNEKSYKEIFTKESEIPWQSLIKAIQIADIVQPQR